MYKLRPEQQAAVDKTYQYWQQSQHATARRFLWNAKPRFGKTFAAYEFMRKINAERVLIVTNRPVVSDAWSQDFFKFIRPETDYIFASAKSHTPKLAPAQSGSAVPTERIYSRAELIHQPALLKRPLIFFISLQDLKGKSSGSRDFKAKNQWLFNLEKSWDLLIIDEGHEGIKTHKTFEALSNLKTNFTLYLSGTPFRAVADQDFSNAQIFNWTYLDEQKTYSDHPRLDFRVCPLADFLPKSNPSNLASIDLGKLFESNTVGFVHPELVQTWLDRLAIIFQQQSNLRHSFWLLSKISDCKSLQTLLREHPFFRDFQVIVAAGKNQFSASAPENTSYAGQKVLANLRGVIGPHPDQTQTITLSCGQLTTGITVPEWSGIFMLYSTNDLSRLSSAQYLQTIFRAQTPASGKSKSYIFDFAPERALTALQDYAQSLCDLPAESALTELMQYLSIQIFDADGHIAPLNAAEAVELPHKIIAREIVDGGFIASNKLFNIRNIFHISEPARKIVGKLSALHKNRLEKNPRPLPRPTTKLDTLGQPLINSELLKQACREVLKNSKYHKLTAKDRQQLYRLVLSEAAETTTLDSLPPAEQIVIKNALREIKTTAHRLAHRRQKREEEDYRDKLRGFSRTIPMLLHIYGEPNFAFSDLASKIPDSTFLELTGITKHDFEILHRENYFNEQNCTLAIREFMRREQSLANYFAPDTTQNIFDFIPLQYGKRVFTPHTTAEYLVAKLKSVDPQLFQSRSAKFFDPAAKSGLLLAVIVRELFQNLRPTFPNDHDCLLHIFASQIYAWAPDEISHRTLLQTLFSFIRAGSINFSKSEIHAMKQHLSEYNPLSAKPSLKNYQNNIWEEEMRFDVIISNPPYQLGRRQIYADFYKLAVDLDPELLCMVFPQGWQKPHNHNGLGQLNNARYKRDPHLVSIDNYDQKAAERLFPNIGTGGVNIVLRSRNFNNQGHIPQLIAGVKSGSIILPLKAEEIAKPAELTVMIDRLQYQPKIDSLGSARKPYGFYADPLRHPEKYHLELFEASQHPDDVRLFGLLDDVHRGFRYISRSSLPKVSPNIDHYKLFVPKAWGNMATNIGLGGSYSNICVASPGDVCSETFLEFGPFASQQETIKAAKYFMTKFFRALLFLAKDSQNTAKDKYRYIPLPDFNADFWQSQIIDLDQKLFELYDVPPATREFIIQNLQPRSAANIEIL